MKPQILLAADPAKLQYRINRVRRSGADSSADEKCGTFCVVVSFYGTRQPLRLDRELFIDFDKPQIFPADSGDLNRLLDRGVGLRGRVRDQLPATSFSI